MPRRVNPLREYFRAKVARKRKPKQRARPPLTPIQCLRREMVQGHRLKRDWRREHVPGLIVLDPANQVDPLPCSPGQRSDRNERMMAEKLENLAAENDWHKAELAKARAKIERLEERP